MSQQLVALQRETGVSLIERRGRRIELTSAHTLLEHAHVIFAQLERAEADLAAAAARLDDTVRPAASSAQTRPGRRELCPETRATYHLRHMS